MAKPRYRKATEQEKEAYLTTKPVYPLVGFIRHEGRDLPVEGLFEGKDEPNYEVMAPKGLHFSYPNGEGAPCASCLHSLLATTLKDALDRVASEGELTTCRGN